MEVMEVGSDRLEMPTKFWSENPKEWDNSEDLGVDWEDNIRMDLMEMGLEGVDWMRLAEDKDQWWTVMIMEMNLRFLWKAGYFLIIWVTIHFSRKTLLHGVSEWVS